MGLKHYKIAEYSRGKMLGMKYTWLLACFNTVCINSSTVSYENVTRLKSDMLNGYDPDLRPLNNQSGVLDLTVSMTLYYILEVNTLRGTVTAPVVLTCQWFDERIAWTPSDYGGINSVMIRQESVWVPPLALSLPAEIEVVGSKWMHVTYQSNGFAFWMPSNIMTSTCPMNMKYWPFDEQTCELAFYPYDYFTGGINISVSGFTTVNTVENGEWSIQQTYASELYSYDISGASFTMTIKRRPLFYVLVLILPMFLLSLLTGFVFMLPSDSGERVGYSITVLLSLTVFLTILSDNIPKLSNPVPILSIGLLTGVLMSGLTTIAVILNLAIFHRNPNKPVGQWYVGLVNMTRCRSNKVKNDDEIIEINTNAETMKPKLMLDNAENGDDVVTWKDVSHAIDKILFVVVTVLQTLPVVVLLIMFNSY